MIHYLRIFVETLLINVSHLRSTSSAVGGLDFSVDRFGFVLTTRRRSWRLFQVRENAIIDVAHSGVEKVWLVGWKDHLCVLVLS